VAVVPLPSRRIISVELQGEGPATPADMRLVRSVMESLELDDEPRALADAARIDLGDGLSLDLPKGWRAAEPADPNRLGRTIFFDESYDDWLSAELIPCIVPPDVASPKLVEILSRHADPL